MTGWLEGVLDTAAALPWWAEGEIPVAAGSLSSLVS
jgi:hypothetical protein